MADTRDSPDKLGIANSNQSRNLVTSVLSDFRGNAGSVIVAHVGTIAAGWAKKSVGGTYQAALRVADVENIVPGGAGEGGEGD